MTWQAKNPINADPLNGLRGGEFVLLATIDASAAQDVALELTIKSEPVPDPGPVSICLLTSLDGSVWSTGVTSGFDASKVGGMALAGVQMLDKGGAAQTVVVSLARALGWMPPFVRVVIQNASPDTLPTSGHSAAYALSV